MHVDIASLDLRVRALAVVSAGSSHREAGERFGVGPASTQADPLADNRPAAPQAVSSLGRDAAPRTSFLTDAPAVSGSRLGAASLTTGLGYLLASREDGAGPTAGLLANTPETVPRDGPSAYGYARQSPVMWSDRSGLQQITGFIKHGINQIINRGICPSDILNTIKESLLIVPQSNGTVQYRGLNATIVLNPAGLVVTAWPQ